MQPFYSASQCIPWLVVLIIECLATVILNIITIVVFMKKKRQRWSLCLIIHLVMVDLLAGAVSGPMQIERRLLQLCPLGNYRERTSWSFYLSFAIFTFILVHFPNKSYGYFLRTATRNIFSIQASLCEEMGL